MSRFMLHVQYIGTHFRYLISIKMKEFFYYLLNFFSLVVSHESNHIIIYLIQQPSKVISNLGSNQ